MMELVAQSIRGLCLWSHENPKIMVWYPRRATPGDVNREEVREATLAPSAGNLGAGHPDTDSSNWR